MLTRMAIKFAGVVESDLMFQATVEYQCEHRFAECEYQHEYQHESQHIYEHGAKAEPVDAREAG